MIVGVYWFGGSGRNDPATSAIFYEPRGVSVAVSEPSATGRIYSNGKVKLQSLSYWLAPKTGFEPVTSPDLSGTLCQTELLRLPLRAIYE